VEEGEKGEEDESSRVRERETEKAAQRFVRYVESEYRFFDSSLI